MREREIERDRQTDRQRDRQRLREKSMFSGNQQSYRIQMSC